MPTRHIIDLLVQRSVFEVFAAAGVSVAPTPYGSVSQRTGQDDLVGVVQLAMGAVRASLSICVAPRTLERASGQLARSSAQDYVRELANQLAGRIKNRLARYQVPVEAGLPIVLDRAASRPAGGTAAKSLVYVFRTMTDDVQVELSHHFSSLELKYTGSIDIAEEGDVILF